MSRSTYACGQGSYVPEIKGMSLTAFRGSYQGTGASVATVTITLEDYEYSSSDLFLVFVNGLNLLDEEFEVSGNDNTVTITLADPINMQPEDVIEIIAVKCIPEMPGGNE